jgi:fibronectin type 3 domain-containing protein
VKCYYKIVARNGDLKSDIAATTSASATRPAPAVTSLDKVVMESATGHSTGIIVRWAAVENAKLYQVYRRAADETSWTLLTNTGSLGYKDTTAEVGVKYYYKVVARNGDVKSSMDIAAVSAVRP